MRQTQEDFLAILTSYQAIIHKVNLIYFTNPTDRQDNFQEVVYQLWRSFPALKSHERPASWIYAVAINTSISKLRKTNRLVIGGDEHSIPDGIEISDSIETNLNFERLLEAIHHLGEIDKSIMLLYLEEYSYEQIATIVGLNPSNVGARINRAKDKLRQHLTDNRLKK